MASLSLTSLRSLNHARINAARPVARTSSRMKSRATATTTCNAHAGRVACVPANAPGNYAQRMRDAGKTQGVAKAAIAAVKTVDIAALEPVAYLSALSAVLYYFCLTINAVMMFTGEMTPKHKNWGVRVFGNMTEQWPMFLSALWTHAIFVSPVTAVQAGYVWLAMRALYPFVRLFTNENEPATMATTMPQYFVNVYLVFAVVMKIGFGATFNPFLSPIVYMVLCGTSLMVVHPIAKMFLK
ncbi:hypothetical protein NFJ02_01g36400 [Pycnococcus provasolii]